MTELQQARADWIEAQERILKLERENEALRCKVFETAQAGMTGVMRMYVVALTAPFLFCPQVQASARPAATR